MDYNEILVSIVLTLLPVILTGVIALITYGITWLKVKTKDVQNDTAQKALEAALIETEAVAIDAVQGMYDLFVEDIGKAREDGKLTHEEVQQAIENAKDYFLTHISKRSLGIIEASIGPVEQWLQSLLKAKLAGLKADPSNPL
jgi:hypothetical protein